MLRLLIAIVLLTAIYAAALASFQPWDLALGAVLATALVLLFRQSVPQQPATPTNQPPRRLLLLVPFLLRITWEILLGTWNVLWVVLYPQQGHRPGVVVIPMGERSRTGVLVSAFVAALSPGSNLLTIDWEQRTMLFHFLDARDPDALRHEFQDLYERYQRFLFP